MFGKDALEAYIFPFWFLKAPFCLVAPCGAFVPGKWRFLEILDMSRIKKYAFLEILTFSQKWLPRPNHYAHWIRIEILSKTPVCMFLYLSPRPQNLRKTFNNSFLAWMSTLISDWRRRRRFPKNSLHLVGSLEHHAQEPNILCGESLTSTSFRCLKQT